MSDAKREPEQLRAVAFTGAVEWIDAKAPGPKRFTMRAYNGGMMRLANFSLPVVVDLAGVDATQQRRPILRDHNTDLIVGHSEQINIKGTIDVQGIVSETGDAAAEVVARSREGFPWQASIGAPIHKLEHVKAGTEVTVNNQKFAGPVLVARETTLAEISFVALGADDGTWAAIAAGKEIPMPEETTTVATPDALRIEKIHALCGEDDPAMALKAIRENWSLEQTALELLKAKKADLELQQLRASRPTGPGVRGSINGSGTPRQIVAAAFLCRAGRDELAAKLYGDATTSQARTHAMSFVDIARLACQLDGREIGGASKSEILASAFSTGSASVALGDSVHKLLVESFKASPAAYRDIVAKKSTTDFKTNYTVRPNALEKLEVMAPDGQIPHATWGEDTLNYSIKTYSRMITITRKDLINDDAGFFDSIPTNFANAALTTVNNRFATVFMNNSSFFTSGRNNYFSGAGTALQASSLATAIKMLRVQTNDKGDIIDQTPAVLLVPPELEFTANQLVNSSQILPVSTAGGPDGNPFQGKLKVVVEPRLSNSSFTGYSTTAWYLLSGPAGMVCIGAFLNGKEEPVIESAPSDFNTLGMSWRAYIDFEFAQGEYRAGVMSKGSA